MPERQSLPYFIPVWLVFGYIGGAAAWQWPSTYIGLFLAPAVLYALVPRAFHDMSMRQWFFCTASLPRAVMTSLAQTIKFFTFSL